MKIKGLSKTEPIIKNKQGGMSSASPYRFDLIPPEAMFRVAEIFAYGAKKYTDDNWRKVTSEVHLNHLYQHLYAYMEGDKQDDHLGNALCRMMMFVTTEIKKGA